MTPDVAAFLKAMLLSQQISVAQPDMLAVAELAAKALTQLDALTTEVSNA